MDSDLLMGENGFENMELEATLSYSGDDCHMEILNVNKGPSGNYAKKYFRPPQIFMCCEGEEKQLSLEEYEDLLNHLC